ncbi:Transformation/transcription domain-associated protein [Dirofilaria immitis]
MLRVLVSLSEIPESGYFSRTFDLPTCTCTIEMSQTLNAPSKCSKIFLTPPEKYLSLTKLEHITVFVDFVAYWCPKEGITHTHPGWVVGGENGFCMITMNISVSYATPQSQQQTSQQQSQIVKPMAHSLQAAAQGHSLLSRLETLIQTIGDAGQRDDLKLKALQEISNSFEEMATTPAFQIMQENLLRTFLKIFQDTVPQFIGENNTQQLRKLTLELILRMNCNEIIKQYAKLILTQLTKVIQVENEENAIIAIKIISEHQRAFRAVFTPEIPAIINHFKAVYRDMPQHITSGRMFEQRNLRHCGMEDSVIESSLQNCYMPTIVYLPETSGDGTQRDSGYSLIPRASQSVKVLSEVPMFFIILFQIHRHHIQNELMEIISLIVQYCTLSIPHDQQRFISSRSAVFNVSEVVNNHGTQIVQSIMQMLERCPHENYSMRRELIGTVKNIFVTDLQTKFIPVIPKLFNENLMLGSGFSSMDFLRPTMYTMLADLVHHVRGHLSYNLLCCSVYAFTKSMFDPAIQPTVQSMCIKLMMNLIESFVITEKNHPDKPCRDILFCLLENYVRKLKWLARYQVPVILEKNANSIMNTPLLYPDRSAGSSQSSRSDFSYANGKSKMDETVIHKKVIKEDPTSPLSSENDFDLNTWDNENEKNNSSSSFSLPVSVKTGKTSTPEEIFNQYWVTGIPSYTLVECRNMIRVLVQACKHAVHALKDTHATNHAISADHEAKIIEQLFRYGLRCLDIYVICPMSNQVSSTQQRFSNGVRTKEEKEVLELFGSIFTLLNPSIFKEIISKRIDYFIERLASNYGLQIICSSLLVNALTSANFGDILIRFLMKKLPDLAECSERSFLWLKLFKIVFSSVGSQPSGCAENERMLRPYLHDLVLQSMKLALRAREPINYFLLLRALFRSIGGGSYDLLYQTFLPLLPTLLHQLNRLQSSTHRTQMRELFIELCLTVPVRLSSLLPYLPLLMDPLVCALNGSSSLIQQGLRTLELCVDNLQPDYLYEHMAPVRAELIRGLWQCMSSQEKNAPQIAFRILGKFGASNRKMLIDPQNLVFKDEHSFESPAFQLVFRRPSSAHFGFSETLTNETQNGNNGPPFFCELNISEVVKESVRHLRSPFVVDASFIMATAQTIPGGIRISSLTIRRHAFRIIKGVILSTLRPIKRGILKNSFLKKHLTTKLLELRAKNKCGFHLDYHDRYSRSLYLDALLGLFYATAAVLQEATSNVMDFFCMVIRHLTIQIIFEQCREKNDKVVECDSNALDYTVLIDSVLLALTDPCKEVCQTSLMALKLICETAVALFGSINKASNTIFFQQILERATNLCYNEPWCIRLGGCLSIKFFLINFPSAFVINNIDAILCALFEVIVGLMEDVSNSAVDVAVATLDLLLKVCFEQPSVHEKKNEAIQCVIGRIIENFLTPSQVLSKQCQKMLMMLADCTGHTQCELLSLQNESLRKFLENGMIGYKKMSLDQQIAFEDAFVFIFSIRPVPQEFILDKFPENDYVSQLLSICNATGKEIRNRPNYKPSTRFLAVMHRSQFNSRVIALRQSTIRALVACCIASCGKLNQAIDHDPLFPHHKQIFEAILKCLMEENEDIQSVAFSALKEALRLDRLRSQLLKMNLGSMITVLSESTNRLEKHVVLRLLYILRLFPDVFSETFCNDMVDAFRKFPDPSQNDVVMDDVEVGKILLEILAEFPLADASFVRLIIPHVCRWEAAVSFEGNTSWRYPLMKYLTRFPLETLRFFVTTSNICEQRNRELFKYVVKHEEAIAIQEKLMTNNSFLLRLLQGESMDEAGTWTKCDLSIYDMEILAMKLIVSIGKRHSSWAGNGAGEIVKVIQSLWNDKDFRARYTCKDYLEGPRYEVPKLAALVMLRYFKANIDRIDILFDLCHVFTNNYIGDFTFVRLFIEKEIIPKYPIEWRQNALKRIVAMFEKDSATAHDLNVVKMLQYVVIPSLHYAFERYDVDMVVGTPAKPDDIDDNNLISLVCQKVLDRNRFHISDAMLIQLFHLGCLFVSNCPTHIHDFSQKKQGNRLRILMLLGWPCLSSTPQDQTMKYMGHLLIANIINQFNINRKIVLQVFLSLLKATLSDPKDIIKRSLDILTPSVPLRMDDGHKQLMTVVKKTIVEEGHNVSQIYHCLSMIVRHYKIYYNVRHQMLQVILNGVQRLMLAQGTLENRRTAIDVCEMVIKWEQWRIKQTEELEKTSEISKQSQTETVGCPSLQQQPPSLGFQVQNKDAENIHRPIEKVHIDHVVNMLVKLSSAVPDANLAQNPTQHAVAMEQLCKRCLGLLRACLKSSLWGLTANLRLSWLEKQLTVAAEAVTQQFREQTTVAHHFSQLHTSLDIITHLIVILPQEVIVTNVKMLQRGIVACLNCQDNSVMRSLCQLISKLFEKTKCSSEGLDELETINQFVTKFINDTFSNYEKGQSQPMTGVFATIHLLRTICVIQPAYVDTMCLSSFTKAVQKLVREHVSSCTENKGHALTELIIFSLELLRPRIHAIPPEARRNIGQCILTPLIDKTPFDRVLDIVIRVVDIMVRNGDERQLNQGVPLLIRLVQTMEAHKRHEKSIDLLKTLLETVLYVYETVHLRTSETLAKLNSAFHWGLCVQDESLRSRFFKLFDAQVPKNICDRLYHIITSQNWADMQQHFWIKHCINLFLSLIMDEHKDKNGTKAKQTLLLNCCTLWQSFEKLFDLETLYRDHPEIYDGDDIALWAQDTTENKRDDFVETSGTQILSEVSIPICSTTSAQDLQITLIVEQQIQLFEMAAKFQITDILPSYLELIHNNNDLASKIWIKLFLSLWSSLQEFKRAILGAEIVPFLSSGCHLVQRDLPHSAIATFLEAICRCQPPISIHPNVLVYISMRHHAWHRGLMMLEQEAAKIPTFTNNPLLLQILQPSLTNMQLVTLNSLILLYSKLSEFDQYQAIWKRRAYFEETAKAIEYYNEGNFVRAEETLRKSIEAINDRVVAPSGTNRQLDVTPALGFELREWHKLWADCERELGEWNALLQFGNTPAVCGLGIVADAAWHLNDWNLLRVTLTQLEGCTQPDLYYKYYLYKAMLMNHHPMQEDRATELLHVRISRELEAARDDLITEWKRLPDVVSLSHVNILQAANLIQEIQEASVLTNHPEVSGQVSLPSNPIGDVKSVVKAWRSRSYALSDPLSFWTDIHQWRIHHYNTAIKLLQQMEGSQSNQLQQGLLPVYSAANSQLMIARAARKTGLINVAIDRLSRMHTLSALPAMDAYFSLRELLKCLLQRASMPNLTEEQKYSALIEAFSVAQKTTINTFTKENIAKLYSLRGKILMKLEKYEDASHSFKNAALLHENVAGGNSVWLHWADFLESRLDAEKTEEVALNAGIEALVGIMEGARMENELRARKYIVRLLWLMKKLSVYGSIAEKEVDAKLEKHGVGIPASNWLPWLPQLVAELQVRPSVAIARIISHVGESSEQQVFYAIAASQSLDFILENVSTALDPLKNDQNNPATSEELFRNIIRKLCQSRPVEISALCRLLFELNSVKEHWLERTLHEVNHLKDRLFRFAYKNLDCLTSLLIPENFLMEIRNWRCSLNDFTGFKEINEDIKKCAQDIEFAFDIQKGRNDKLIDLLNIVVKWSSLLAIKFDKLPSKKLIRNVSQILSSYSSKVANVEIFNGHYTVKNKEFSAIIYRFMPYYFVIRRADIITRRISVRALNGRVYCYYLTKHYDVNRDASGIHQLFALINHFLTKEKETCRRFLQLAVPHVAYIGNISLFECTNKMNSLYTFEEILNAILKNKTNISSSAKLIEKFYDRISESANVTDQLLLDEFHHMTSESILPIDSLSKWLIPRYEDPTHYYTLRKQVALNMSVLSICEYILHLNPITICGLYLNTRTGQIMNVDYLFGLKPETLELEVDRVVPYRMSPNLHKFLGFSVEGHYNCSIVATIRCLHARKIVVYAQLFLWDAFSRQRKLPAAEIFKLAQSAGKLLESRLNDLYKTESLADYIAQLTQTARKDENLARLDPRLHPWF